MYTLLLVDFELPCEIDHESHTASGCPSEKKLPSILPSQSLLEISRKVQAMAIGMQQINSDKNRLSAILAAGERGQQRRSRTSCPVLVLMME